MAENKPTVKTLYFDINIDQQKVKNEVNDFVKLLGEGTEQGVKDGISSAIENASKNKQAVETLKRKLSDLEGLKDFAKDKKEIDAFEKQITKIKQDLKVLGFGDNGEKNQKQDKFAKESKEILKDIGTKLLNSIKEFFTDIVSNVKDYLDEISAYNVSGSIFGTSAARRKMLQYGTSESQTYGLTKAMSTLNLGSEEDLWYMNSNQREKFAQLIGRYTSKYEELANKDFFKSYEEFKLEFTLLKEDLTYDLLQVVIDNKDTIKTFLELGVKAMSGAINFFGKIGSIGSVPTTESILNTYNQKSISNSNSYSFVNTFNVSDTSTAAAKQFSSAIIAAIRQTNNS